MKSPTGSNEIRGSDKHGSGHYLAPRGDRRHAGIDMVVAPGQDVLSPIDGVMARVAKPYAKGKWSGCVVKNDQVEIKMFYMAPDKSLVSQEVKRGQVIGKAQDIGEKYKGITPHVHVEISSINPALLLDMP